MNSTVSTASSLSAERHPNQTALLKAISSPLRCAMLLELATGEPRMVIELARKTGCKPVIASKHLGVLRRAGLIVLTRRNYQLPRHFIVNAELGHLDFGHCLLRLTQPAGQPTA
jgi:DNA-binding transcriptional ArsR family regulator